MPARPSAQPMMIAMSASGKRMSQRIILSVVDRLSGEIRPFKIVRKDKFDGPVMMSRDRNAIQRKNKQKRKLIF
ncbi:hypothetical protein NBRC116602_17600 [Hyphomicrobiales bacterium 4NK60-0047b]